MFFKRFNRFSGGARVQLFDAASMRASVSACARELESDIFYSAECVTGN